jgi:hypothetical protein
MDCIQRFRKAGGLILVIMYSSLVLAETFLSEQAVVGAGNLGKNNK